VPKKRTNVQFIRKPDRRQSKRQIRVLFVEDDRAARDGYTEYLTRCGYDVRTAATGHEALTLAIGWVPNVVVLDLGLPDIDGWEVARRLKATPQTTAVPIIALTGAGLTHERVSAMRAGCDRHLAKPCAPSEIVEAIERCTGELT
jgi:CheY-like chemotaxis protein